jgi:hypothetical protein
MYTGGELHHCISAPLDLHICAAMHSGWKTDCLTVAKVVQQVWGFGLALGCNGAAGGHGTEMVSQGPWELKEV